MNDQRKIQNNTTRTILLVLFSVFCSLLLWVYVTETRGEDIDQPFPGVKVEFIGESTLRETRELIVSDVSATSVRVTLTGNRRTLAALSSADLAATIDLSNITRTGNYSLSPRITYPSGTDASSVSYAVTSPSTVSFYVDKLDKKTLEVEGVFNGSAAEGYVVEPLEFSPGTVIIYGPAQVLAEVDHAYVEVDRTDVDKTLTFDSTYTLIGSDGSAVENDDITVDTDTVSVTLPISAVKEVDLTIELIPGGGATKDNVKWSLDTHVVTLTGDSDALAGVNNISVVSIDLSMVDESFSDTYRIPIPNNTEITSGTRETTLTLEIGGLYKRTVSISKSNIACINVSEGYSAEIMNDSLDNVVLRGPEEIVRSISRGNVRAVADLTEFGTATGIVSVPVRISVDSVDGSAVVGAVGEYWVYVNITVATAD